MTSASVTLITRPAASMVAPPPASTTFGAAGLQVAVQHRRDRSLRARILEHELVPCMRPGCHCRRHRLTIARAHHQRARKREALENVLIPYRLEENIELLTRDGFQAADTFFRWCNFASIVAAMGARRACKFGKLVVMLPRWLIPLMFAFALGFSAPLLHPHAPLPASAAALALAGWQIAPAGQGLRIVTIRPA